MANAKKDGNYISTLLGVLNSDGSTIVPVQVNATNRALKVDDNTTGSDNGPSPSRALRDENRVPVFMAVSDVDGVTPVAIYADSEGKLLIDSN
jgi:hypothetical protein